MFENQSIQHHHQLLLKLLLQEQLGVEKERKKSSKVNNKFLFYNMGIIQYSNTKFKDQLNQQQNKITNQDQYIQKVGYPIKKSGVHISDIKNDNKFGWTIQDKEFYFIFKFLMRDKKNYNPDISKQKQEQEKKEKQGSKELTWKFNVKVAEQIQFIKQIIDEVYPNYCNFIDKLNNLEIEIYDSKSLLKELKNNKIEDKHLSYIFSELISHSNNPNKIIVAAEIACRSLQNHFANQEEYQSKKLEVIKSILDNLYQPHQNSANIIRHIANKNFLNGQDIQLKDAPLFNALTQNLLFSIDLDVVKFINGHGFYSCLNFNSLQELKKPEDDKKLINYENRSQIIDIINKQTKDKNQQLIKIKKYIFCLFGMKTHYYSKCLVELYKFFQDSFYLKKAFKHFKKDSPFLRDFQENTKLFYEEYQKKSSQQIHIQKDNSQIINNSQSQGSQIEFVQFSYMKSQQEREPSRSSDQTIQQESTIVRFSYMMSSKSEVQKENIKSYLKAKDEKNPKLEFYAAELIYSCNNIENQQDQEFYQEILQENFKIYIEKSKISVQDIKFFQSLIQDVQIDNIKILLDIINNFKSKKIENINCYYIDLIQKLIHQLSDQKYEPDEDFQKQLKKFWFISQHHQTNQIIN